MRAKTTINLIKIIEKAEICPTCNGSGLSVFIHRAEWPGGKVKEKEVVKVCKVCEGKKIV